MTNTTMRHPPLVLPWQDGVHPPEGWQRLVAARTMLQRVEGGELILQEIFLASVECTNDISRKTTI